MVVLSALLYLYCGSASNKSLKHKVFGCFLVHFLPGSGCIGVGGVDGGVVLVVVVVVVVRVVVEVVAFYLIFLISGNALDNSLRETWSVWLHPVVHSESLSGCIGSAVGFDGCWDGGE